MPSSSNGQGNPFDKLFVGDDAVSSRRKASFGAFQRERSHKAHGLFSGAYRHMQFSLRPFPKGSEIQARFSALARSTSVKTRTRKRSPWRAMVFSIRRISTRSE